MTILKKERCCETLFFHFVSDDRAHCRRSDRGTRNPDGTIYRNVTVEQVDPAGLTIGFINENGTSVLKRIPFEELDAAVQQQYRYDPERARRYEERREQLSRDSIEEMKASSEQAGRTETIRAKLRERFNGKNVEVSRDDLLFLIRSNRRALRVNGVEAAESGTLVRVLQDDSGLDALPMMILADGLKLKADESWTGFLYPTGLKARIQGNANLPVFCSSAEMAADLVSGYLDIYYQFVASGGTTPPENRRPLRRQRPRVPPPPASRELTPKIKAARNRSNSAISVTIPATTSATVTIRSGGITGHGGTAIRRGRCLRRSAPDGLSRRSSPAGRVRRSVRSVRESTVVCRGRGGRRKAALPRHRNVLSAFSHPHRSLPPGRIRSRESASRPYVRRGIRRAVLPPGAATSSPPLR
ncbi:MAG: hypothetical protein L6W00_06200 [Lentisphaeria bacterium]|nr:MAG: hypothetical protein L6W00_06200 [Lentisphaeria bacterium]